MKKVLSLLLLVSFSLFCGEEDYRNHVKATLKEFNPSATDKKLKQLQGLADHVRKVELAHPEYYQVLSAQDPYYLGYQIILEEFYKADFKHFTFLRATSASLPDQADLFLQDHPTLLIDFDAALKDYSSKTNKNDPSTDDFFRYMCDTYSFNPEELDSSPEISYQLISASLGLATALPMDSAAWVFSKGHGVVKGKRSMDLRIEDIASHTLKALAHETTVSKPLASVVKELIEATPVTDEGLLLQFFFEKSTANTRLYPSLSLGFYNYAFDGDLDLFFETYRTKSLEKKFNRKENYQVRILAGALDPESVRIKRYTLIRPEQVEAYRAKVRIALIPYLNH